MEYVTLNNGVQLPMIGFGTWDVRGEAGKKTILTALDSGYRLIDTAQMYENEDIVGQAVKESGLERKEVFLTTKLYRPCVTYEKAKAAIEKSLQALQTDYIDLLLIHEPYDSALEMYEAMKEAYRAGKVRAIGISNFNEKKYQAFVAACVLSAAGIAKGNGKAWNANAVLGILYGGQKKYFCGAVIAGAWEQIRKNICTDCTAVFGAE